MTHENSQFLPERAIIGGSALERLIYATKLRRLGISVAVDFRDVKRSKAFKRAALANRWGQGGIYDLDDAEDRAWLDLGENL